MAEFLAVVGAVASVIQLVEFSTKVAHRLNNFVNDVGEVPQYFREITLYLPLFIEVLQRTQGHIENGRYNPLTSNMLRRLVDECTREISQIEEILTKVTPSDTDSEGKRKWQAVSSLKYEKAFLKIKSKLLEHIQMLQLFQTTVASDHVMMDIRFMKQHLLQISPPQDNLLLTGPIKNDATTGKLPQDTEETNKKPRKEKNMAVYYRRKEQYRMNSFISLARLGLLWRIQATLDLSWGSCGYSVEPSLRIQRMVRHTSPGFQTFWKYYTGQMDLASAVRELESLFHEGRASPLDIDPRGQSWLEEIRLHWGDKLEGRVAFVRILLKYGVQLNTPSIIPLFIKIPILLQETINQGYDFSNDVCFSIDDTLMKSEAFSLSSLGHRGTDRFLLLFSRKCSTSTFGAWGQTLLMDAILSGPMDDVIKYMRVPQSHLERNDFGQSPLHLAVLRPTVLSRLLEQPLDLDVLDREGLSPLIYAAQYGCVESVLMLLKAGANPVSIQRNGKRPMLFLDHAIGARHWNVVTAAFTFFQSSACYSDDFLNSEVNYFGRTFFHYIYSLGPEDLKAVIGLLASSSLTLQSGNTPLHQIVCDGQAEVLLDARFDDIECPNIYGRTPLMSTIKRYRESGYQTIIRRGANVNHQDSTGITALHVVSQFMQLYLQNTVALSDFPSIISEWVTRASLLLCHGANPEARDKCRCPCSPNGCSPSTHLIVPGRRCDGYDSRSYIWVLEWLLILKTYCGASAAHKAMIDLTRIKVFDKLDMTHVCCRRPSRYNEHQLGSFDDFEFKPMEEDEIDEILEEEKDFISNLDDIMEQFARNNPDSNLTEESWLKVLGDTYVPTAKLYTRTQRWTSSWGLPHSYASIKIVPVEPQIGNTDTPGQSCYFVDESDDLYLEKETNGPAVRVPASHIYGNWVEYFFQHHAKNFLPAKIDIRWRTDRKYWASRQAEVLQSSSPGYVEDIMKRIGALGKDFQWMF